MKVFECFSQKYLWTNGDIVEGVIKIFNILLELRECCWKDF
jgi:hypothetical protein